MTLADFGLQLRNTNLSVSASEKRQTDGALERLSKGAGVGAILCW